MSLSNRILILDEDVDLATLSVHEATLYRSVLCLFWLAPSTRTALEQSLGTRCFGLADMISSGMAWGERAYDLAKQVAQGGPSYGPLFWRSYLMEALYREAHKATLLAWVVDFLEGLRQKWALSALTVDGILDKRTAHLFSSLLTGHPTLAYRSLSHHGERGLTGEAKGPLARLAARVGEACVTGGWRTQAMDLIESLDKTFRWRTCLGRWKGHRCVSQGRVAFFSSYVNNSRVLSSFADLMPFEVDWIIVNDSARRGLPMNRHNYFWIWEFAGASPSKIPDERLESTDSPLISGWLDRSPLWQSWTALEFSLLLRLTACWENYLSQAKPRLVVMSGQWGIEGWFTHIARAHGIPVLQVMHGALGGYLHTRTPVVSDQMVVSGDFWRHLWPEDQREKIIVNNPLNRFTKVEKRPESRKRRLTFFSWPLVAGTYHNFSELMDGFIPIFHRIISGTGCHVTVRAHPQENPSDFVHRWRRLKGPLPSNLQISKQEPLEHVLKNTDVALMFRSTVMLDCLLNKIPVVIPGWIDYGWNKRLLDAPGVHLASDFLDLEGQLLEWLDHPPLMKEEFCQYFIRPPGAGSFDFRRQIDHLVERAVTGRLPIKDNTPVERSFS